MRFKATVTLESQTGQVETMLMASGTQQPLVTEAESAIDAWGKIADKVAAAFPTNNDLGITIVGFRVEKLE